MSIATSYSPPIPFPVGVTAPASAPVPALAFSALSLESTEVDVTELVTFATRLHTHAAREGEAVSPLSLVAKAFLVASMRHPAVDARWPMLPARHGMQLRELTAALDGSDAASTIPDDAAILSVGAIAARGDVSALELRLAFDPRRTDSREAHRFVEELAGLLADPWELIAQGS
jgi:pyruvate/2-oxoglutarate dehydrogenase complex dihydrolipoamide acyltransferase (E2) component